MSRMQLPYGTVMYRTVSILELIFVIYEFIFLSITSFFFSNEYRIKFNKHRPILIELVIGMI